VHEPRAAAAGWELPKPVGGAPGAAPVAAAAFNFAEVAEGLKKSGPANVQGGADAFKKCAACHTVTKGGDNRVGPNMWGIVQRAKAAHPGFNYSDALKGKGGNWSFENMASFIWDPRGYAPGNKMAFAGVKDKQEIVDLLAYLRTLSDAPAPLPQ
jgi:cytochrome c